MGHRCTKEAKKKVRKRYSLRASQSPCSGHGLLPSTQLALVVVGGSIFVCIRHIPDIVNGHLLIVATQAPFFLFKQQHPDFLPKNYFLPV